MRASNLFGQTLREAPADAEIPSHKLLIRGAFIRRVAAGIFAWLPLGWRVMQKLSQIVREEMDAAGATEMIMPSLQPGDLWKKSGRWAEYGPVLYRIKDRGDRDFCLAPTHEEVIAMLADTELASYKDMPSVPYQIQWKFRDEPRARGGLLRCREFLMKDAYSFHPDEEGLKVVYDRMMDAYRQAFERCGLSALMIEAQAGEIGGSGRNHEFIQPSASGEDTFVRCDSCGYAANTEVAVGRVREPYDFGEPPDAPRRVETPGLMTVPQVAEFLKVGERALVKSLLYRAGDNLVCAVVPGDREVNEYKLDTLVGDSPQMLTETEFAKRGIAKGFTGPVALEDVRVIADRSLRGARNLVTGGNERDIHLTGVVPGRDFEPGKWADLIVAVDGDVCDRCGTGTLRVERGIEVGHIFELGTRYSAPMDVTFSDESGTLRHFVMGCYGLGISRTLASIVEAHHDERGIIWPRSVAPYDVAVVVLGRDESLKDAAVRLHDDLVAGGVESVLDDRDVSAGVKFADADLIGYPLQLVVGKTYAASGRLEAKVRATGERTEIEANVEAVRQALYACP